MKSDPSLPVLFITRKHPPSVGGMQRLSYHLITEISRRTDARIIAWRGGKVALPVFFLYALVWAIRICQRGVRLVHLGDPVLSPIGWLLQEVFCIPVVVTVHGLDITFPVFPYQQIVPRLVGQFRRVVCISKPTLDACLTRGVSASICSVIPPGVEVQPDLPDREEARQKLSQLVGKNLEATKLLLTVGRLVPRKGVAAFVRRVLPTLTDRLESLYYLVVGTGSEEVAIREAIRERGLGARVYMLGHVKEADLAFVYRAADVFVAPNVPCAGDIEGFGLVVLEAAAMALPVVASDLEGLKEAIVPGQNGILLPYDQPDQWVEELTALLMKEELRKRLGERAHQYVATHQSWSAMADRYLSLFESILAESQA